MEKKHINNPITLIAVFAGIIEVVGAIGLKLVASDLHVYFMIFLIGFPSMLVILFFITLWFKPEVLYSPRDFKNDDNFLKVIGIKIRDNDFHLKRIESLKEELRNEFNNEIEKIKNNPEGYEDIIYRAVEESVEKSTNLVKDEFTSIIIRAIKEINRVLDYASIQTVSELLDIDIESILPTIMKLRELGVIDWVGSPFISRDTPIKLTEKLRHKPHYDSIITQETERVNG